MKTIQPKLLWLSAALFVLSTVLSAQSGEKNFIDQNFIEVTGRSEMEITPDRIYLSILLNEKDTKNKVSLEELEKQMMEKLRETGIDVQKDLFVKDVSSNFKYYLLSKTDILLSKEYQLLVYEGKTVGKVMMALEQIGISNISVDRLDHSRMEEFRREVKIYAIVSARDKARDLAVAIGQETGRAIYVKEKDDVQSGSPGTANSIRIRGVSSFGANSVPDIEFEKIRIGYSVLCRFVLK